MFEAESTQDVMLGEMGAGVRLHLLRRRGWGRWRRRTWWWRTSLRSAR
ncbi:MAG: hypothetical protein R3F14_29680 [Polyangiaceae bacterium]